MIIALMGNDGSGKTTVAKELMKIFRELGSEVIYKHEYEYTILKIVFKLVGEKRVEKSRKEMIDEKKRNWKYFIWPILVWFDTFIQYAYFKTIKRNSIVILDRYPYDHYMSFKYLGFQTKFIEWLYLRFPHPDVAIVLWVEPKIAYKRKKSTHSYFLDFYEKQTKEYFNLARELRILSINTNKELKETLKDIMLSILSGKKSKEIFHRGFQNRVIFYILEKYDVLNNGKLRTLGKRYKKRKEMFKRSAKVLKELLKTTKVQNYALIKTLDDFKWIGNDIDVLISKSDFEKIYDEISKNQDRYKIKKINYNRWDEGKMDIFIEDGLKLDIHSHIGWRNVIFFQSNQILKKKFTQKRRIFSIESVTIGNKTNAVLLMITHVFEKGFLTLDEYLFLKKNFDERFLEDTFPNLSKILRDYIQLLKIFLKERPETFPVFIPFRILFKGYINLLKENTSGRMWKIKALSRDLLLMIFWRSRYKIRKTLPFEMNCYE